jgi:4-hydroxybenzoate polyprenyltransferase
MGPLHPISEKRNVFEKSPGNGQAMRFLRHAWHTIMMGLLESRPAVQVIFLNRFLAGAVLTGSADKHLRSIAAGAAAWVAAAVAVYVFNGMMDVVEDRGNGSPRPIASGRLRLRGAGTFTGCAAILAAVLGIGAGVGIEVGLFLCLCYLYSGPPRPAKGSGAAALTVIASLGLVTFYAGTRAAHASSPAAVVFGLVMSGWMTLVGALAKDISDVPGDALGGRRTFPVRYGIISVARCTIVLAAVVGAAGIAASFLTAPILLPSMLVLAVGAYRVVAKCRSLAIAPAAAEQLRAPYQGFMVTQYAVTAVIWITLLLRYAF